MSADPVLRNGVPVLVDVMLTKWAAETAANPVGAWPQVSIIGKLIEYGANGAGAATLAMAPTISDESAQIDAIVAKAPARLRKVIEVYYKTWDTQEVQAKRYGTSLSSFRNDLRAAQWYVYGRLQQ